jgi:ribonuclease T2
MSKTYRWIVAVVLMLAVTQAISARKKPKQSSSGGSFTYYLLSLSYAPDFCAEPGPNKTPQECGAGRKVGFVVHGLWPQGDSGRGPENCGHASPVSQSIIDSMLSYIPTASLMQHEWASHGTCSGLSTADFFATVKKARDSVTIPNDLNQPASRIQLSPSDLEAKMAAANPSFPKEAFRTSCYRDGELQELRICFDKTIAPRACTSSAGECPMSNLTMLPVK